MTSLCFLWEIIHSDFTKYLHQKIFRPSIQAIVIIYSGKLLSLSEQAAFSFRAGYFLFSSRLYSLSNIPNPSRKDSRTSKSPQPSYKQAHNYPTSKAHNLPTSKSPQPSTNKAHNLPTSKVHSLPTSKVHSHPTSKSPQPHHIPIAQKNTQKTSKSSKISPIFYPLTYF